MSEADYHNKLSDKDKDYLDNFNRGWSGGYPGMITDDQDEKRKIWRENKKIQRDAMTFVNDGVSVDRNSGGVEPAMAEILDSHAVAESVRAVRRVASENREAAKSARSRKLLEAKKSRKRVKKSS